MNIDQVRGKLFDRQQGGAERRPLEVLLAVPVLMVRRRTEAPRSQSFQMSKEPSAAGLAEPDAPYSGGSVCGMNVEVPCTAVEGGPAGGLRSPEDGSGVSKSSKPPSA